MPTGRPRRAAGTLPGLRAGRCDRSTLVPHKPARARDRPAHRRGTAVNHRIKGGTPSIQSSGPTRSGRPVTMVTGKGSESEGQSGAALLDIVKAGGQLDGGHAPHGAGNVAEGDIARSQASGQTGRGMRERRIEGAGGRELHGLAAGTAELDGS